MENIAQERKINEKSRAFYMTPLKSHAAYYNIMILEMGIDSSRKPLNGNNRTTFSNYSKWLHPLKKTHVKIPPTSENPKPKDFSK